MSSEIRYGLALPIYTKLWLSETREEVTRKNPSWIRLISNPRHEGSHLSLFYYCNGSMKLIQDRCCTLKGCGRKSFESREGHSIYLTKSDLIKQLERNNTSWEGRPPHLQVSNRHIPKSFKRLRLETHQGRQRIRHCMGTETLKS